MAEDFVTVPFDVDEASLADGAIERLSTEWEDWEPNDGDPEVVQIEAHASMVADAAAQAAVMPASAMRTILQRLHGIEYSAGSYATTTATFTFPDTDPARVISEGFTVDVDGYSFLVATDVAAGDLVAPGVPLIASDPGSAWSELPGATVTPVGAIVVESIVLDTPTAGGTDPETDDEFEAKGVRQLRLRAKTLVTGRDYELEALDNPAVARVLAITDSVAKTVRVIPGTDAGQPIPQTEKDALLDDYEQYRLSNWNVSIEDPTVTTIDVAYSWHPLPTYLVDEVQARIDDALGTYLNPAGWGADTPLSEGAAVTPGRWFLQPRVRKNEVIALISNVLGVDYVEDVTLSGSAGALQANGDWLMDGTVPLPELGVTTPTVV